MPPGDVMTVTFTPPKGTTKFRCTWHSGMVGRIVGTLCTHEPANGSRDGRENHTRELAGARRGSRVRSWTRQALARPRFRHRLITLHIGRLATLGCAGGAPWQLGVALDVCTLAAEESLGAAIDSPRRNPRIGNATGREGPKHAGDPGTLKGGGQLQAGQ